MASEIRVNRLSNRSGLSTITFANGGVQFSGITTFANGEFYVGTGSTILNPSGNELQFHTGGSNRFTINNSGVNLGTGNITAVDGTFTGNVSIAKTLTYEDVKNVDSVGVVTARTGVKVTGGDFTVGTAITASSVTGNVTQDVGITTFSGSATWFKGTTANKDMYWSKSSGSLVFKDSAAALFGDGSDLQLLHNGTNSVINNTTGSLLFQNGGSSSAWINSGGVIYTNNDIIFQGANYNALWDKSKNALILNDNTQINFGTDEDGDIYHDGSQMIINNATGTLKVRSNNLQLTHANNTVHVNCISSGAVELYHNGARKFHTKSQGVAVEGSVNLEGSQATLPSHGGMTRHTNAYVYFTGKSDGNGAILSNGDGTATFRALNPGSSAGYAIIETGNGDTRLTIASDGRIFTSGRTSYSGNTTCDDLVVGDGSGHRGIAISSGSSSEGGIHFGDGESGNTSYRGIIGYNHADDSMQFRTAAAERLRITSAGQLVIGATTSRAKFEIKDNGYTETAVIQRISTDDASPYALVIANDTCNGTATNGMQFFVNNSGDHYIRCRGSSTAGNNNFLLLAQNDMRFSSGSSETERLRITSDGKVGINKTDPSYQLHVVDDQSVVARFERTGGAWAKVDIKAGANTGNSYLTFSDTDASEVGAINYEHNDNSLRFETFDGSNKIERASITSGGTVVIEGGANNTANVQLQDNNIGGVRISVNDETISSAIYLPRDGAIVIITAFSNPDTNGTNYPQPGSSGMAYVDCGPSRNIKIMDTGSDVGQHLVAKAAYTGTVSNCDNNKVTIMGGNIEGTFHIVNRRASEKYMFCITML